MRRHRALIQPRRALMSLFRARRPARPVRRRANCAREPAAQRRLRQPLRRRRPRLLQVAGRRPRQQHLQLLPHRPNREPVAPHPLRLRQGPAPGQREPREQAGRLAPVPLARAQPELAQARVSVQEPARVQPLAQALALVPAHPARAAQARLNKQTCKIRRRTARSPAVQSAAALFTRRAQRLIVFLEAPVRR